MARAARVSLLVGGCVASAFAIYSYAKGPNHYADGTVGVHLGEVIVGAGFFGGAAFLGALLGLRSAPRGTITYSVGLAIALIYVAIAAALNLIPIGTVTLRSDETTRLALSIAGILVLSIAGPYLISRLVRATFKDSA